MKANRIRTECELTTDVEHKAEGKSIGKGV